jgi:chemotaxis protein MotB
LLSEREKALAELQNVIARQDSITKRLNNILRNALLGFNSDELSVEIKNGKVYVSMSDKLLFKSGSSAVEVKGKEALKLLGDVLDKNTDIDILVEGHTDNVPIKTNIYKDNWDLSVARATSIVRILSVDYKIGPTRMTASGRGEYFPKAGNDTAEGKAKNRRTEIILSPKLDEIMKLLEI